MPEISVIIPVYNKRKYLDALFDDLSAQSFADFECLIIDDGSTDGSSDKCDQFAERDRRVKVYHIENSGVSHARNVGLDNTKGEYITFIDSDDRIHKNYLENLYKCITSNTVDIVISGAEKVFKNRNNKTIIMPYHGAKSFDSIIYEFVQTQNLNGLYGYCWSKIFKRELVKNIFFNESLKLAEDLDFYLSIYEKVDTIFFDDKAYYYYLQEADNSSALVNDDNIDYFAQLCVRLKIADFLKTKNAYSNENKMLIDSIIWNFVYLIFYHCEIEKIEELYNKVHSLDLPDRPLFNSFWKNRILKHFDSKKIRQLSNDLKTLRFMRFIKRIIKRK